MHFVSLYCCLVLAAQHGSFSIRFDEYYDTSEVPLEGFDEFNEYNCHHVGSKCTWSEQCCGPATCVLPSWWPTPVCLVPGYKEDNRLQSISARDPIRREDVLYIRNTYNTTFYDFLLNESSSSGPELESTIQPWNANGDDLGLTEDKEESNDSINLTNFSSAFPLSSSDRVLNTNSSYHNVNQFIDLLQNALNHSRDSVEKHNVLDLLENKTSRDLFSTMEEFNTNFLRRFKFLIINSTLEKGILEPNDSEIFEGFKTIDDIMTSVKLLTDKLNELTYRERDIESNTDNSLNVKTSIVHSREEEKMLPSPTMRSMNSSKICRKRSKWSIVKELLLRKRKSNVVPRAENNHNQKIVNDSLEIKSVPNEMRIGNKTTDEGKGGRVKDTIFSILGDIYSRKSENIPSDLLRNKDSDANSIFERTNDESENNIETVKIKLPYQIENRNDDYSENANDIAKNPTPIVYSREYSARDKVTRTSLANYQHNATFQRTQDKNSFTNIINSVRHWFVFPAKVNDSQSPGKIYANNRKFNLGSMSQKVPVRLDTLYRSKLDENCSLRDHVKSGPLQSVTTEVLNTDYSDHPASSSDYSENSEELYKNSYVFMIKQANETNLKAESKWKSMIDFLHTIRINPYRRDKAPNSGKIITEESIYSSTDGASNIFEVTSNHSSENYQQLQRTIRIPENLMPEALEAMQPNLTELLFSLDSYEEY